VIPDKDENSYLLTLTLCTERRGKKRVALLSGERKKEMEEGDKWGQSPL
jgi:hypothetical protein